MDDSKSLSEKKPIHIIYVPLHSIAQECDWGRKKALRVLQISIPGDSGDLRMKKTFLWGALGEHFLRQADHSIRAKINI